MTDTLCCGQPVGPTGFCDVCGRRKIVIEAPPESNAPATPPTTSTLGGTDVYRLSSIQTGAPSLLTDPTYPEDRQYCGTCRRPVGRRIGKQQPIVTGFCPYCRTPFSFEPKLNAGDLVADRYEVLGWLAVGGAGPAVATGGAQGPDRLVRRRHRGARAP